jgi:hypothetical protein
MRPRDQLNALSDEDFAKEFPETRDSYIAFRNEQLKSPFGEGPGVGYADGGLVNFMDFSNLGRRAFAEGGQVPSDEDIASMTHEDSYGTGREMNYLESLGEQFPLGEANYYDVDGERRMPEGVQGLHDIARMGVYGVPGAGPFIGAGLDTVEAVAEDDPLSAGMAVAFGPGGKLAKGAMTGVMGMGMDPEDAEAGVFGRAAKWAKSSTGKDALNDAIKMSSQGADNAQIMRDTGWFKDVDGHWKFWEPSKGGHLVDPLKGNRLGDVLRDPSLFDQYPKMKDIGFRRKNDEGAHWDEGNNEIVLGDTSKPGYNTPDAGGRYGSTLHEVYHAKSSKEKWPQGTSVLSATHQMSKDIRKLNGIADPSPFMGLPSPQDAEWMKHIGGPSNYSNLGFKRYEAEVGEALARREASMREMTHEHLDGITPAWQPMLDMPEKNLFHPGQTPKMETYEALIKAVEDDRAKAVAAAKAWAETAAKATTSKRKK